MRHELRSTLGTFPRLWLRSAEPTGIAPLVAALPERQRLVLFLRYYADLDYAAIAEALNVEVGTVGPTLVAAQRTLRTQLSEVSHE